MDLGEAKRILGMEIERDRKRFELKLTQKEYIKKVLCRFSMENAKMLNTPLPLHMELSSKGSSILERDKTYMTKVPYASAIGSLMYLMMYTRPDIANSVGVVGRYMANSGKSHWEAVKAILRYLKGISSHGLVFCGSKGMNCKLVGYCDSDYVDDRDRRRSTSGYVFTLDGMAISWRSRLQTVVALFTTESELIAAVEAANETLYLKRLLCDLRIEHGNVDVQCDSQSVIHLAENLASSSRTKHIESIVLHGEISEIKWTEQNDILPHFHVSSFISTASCLVFILFEECLRWCMFEFQLHNEYFQDDNDNVLNIILSSLYTSGWVGIGFSNDGMMVGSSAIIGWIGEGSRAQIKQYYLSGQSRSLVVPNEGQLLISKISPEVILYGANIYLAFQLKILAPLSKQELLFAYSEATPNDFQLTEHDDKISVYFDFSEGALVESSYPYELKRNHGALSIFGWGFLLPIGVITARYCKAWDPQWYYLHVLLQFSGFIIGFSGLVSGIALFDKLHSDIYLHKGIGICVFALVILQIIAFFVHPVKESRMRKYWNWYHKWVGRLALFLASCNIIFGIHLGKAGIIWKFGYGITLATTVISATVLEVMSCIRKSHKSVASLNS